jgi:RNA 3'-terminal phosphate cyclase (GTP)
LKLIEIRGDIHEGGGQILRTSLALSARTGISFEMTRIRAGRSRPGLQPQHLAAVRLAAQLCQARLQGDQLGSLSMRFEPRHCEAPSHLSVDVGTAGSITLLLQSVFWALPAVSVELRGGTDVAWSPPFDYLKEVTLPLYRRLADVRTLALTRGFFPKGRGRWLFEVETVAAPKSLYLVEPPTTWDVFGRAIASADLRSRRVAERLAQASGELLGRPIEWDYQDTPSQGCALVLWAASGEWRWGVSALGEKGKSAEQVASLAVERLRHCLAQPGVDEYLGDQLVPLLALVGGAVLCQKVTPHLRANLEVVEAFLGPKLVLQGNLLRSLE